MLHILHFVHIEVFNEQLFNVEYFILKKKEGTYLHI